MRHTLVTSSAHIGGKNPNIAYAALSTPHMVRVTEHPKPQNVGEEFNNAELWHALVYGTKYQRQMLYPHGTSFNQPLPTPFQGEHKCETYPKVSHK